MNITGQCHCGEIKYKAVVDPDTVRVCHCTDCQVMSGSAFRTVVTSEVDGISFIQGKTKEYIKIAESGNQRAQGFCQNCGTAIYAVSVGDVPKIYSIRLGSVDQKETLIPTSQIWCRSSQKWLKNLTDIKTFSTLPSK